MYGTSKLTVHGDYDVILIGESELTIVDDPVVILAGSGECYAVADVYATGNATLPPISGIGSDSEYSVGSSLLPAIIQTSGESGFWVPTPVTTGYATLPSIGGSAISITVHDSTGDATLPAITGLGGDFKYGVGSAVLPFFTSFGMYGLPNDEADIIDYMIIGTLQDTERILSVVFISEGTISDTYTLNRLQAVQFISTLEQSDSMTVLGTFTQSFIDTITASSRNSQNIVVAGNVKPDLNDEGQVWVVNVDTGASSQYEQYGFNSFFNRSDGAYGICSSGIYRLSGSTDAGFPISALVDFGRSDFGTSLKKKNPYVYLGIGSNDEMYLKVDCDGVSHVYLMTNNTIAVKNHRVKVGKGKHGNYWSFTLMNKDGADFDLNAIQFEPIISSRSI